MSWLSAAIKRNAPAVKKLVGKVAAPLAIGALAIPGVGVGISGAVMAAGKALGKVGAITVTKATGALDTLNTRASETQGLLSGLTGTFASGVASGAGVPGVNSALGRLWANPVVKVTACAGAAFVAWRAFSPGRRSRTSGGTNRRSF